MSRFALAAAAAVTASVAVLAWASPARAQVYRWVDDQGEVHYTDNPASIPDAKKKAAVKTEGGDLGYIKGGKSAAKPPPKAPHKAEGVSADDEAARLAADDDAKDRAAEEEEARLEQEWRGKFREAQGRVERLEKMLASDKKALADPRNSGIPMMPPDYNGVIRPNPEFDAIKRRIPEEEKQLAQAKENLADLDREASRQSVPQHWRR